MADDKSTPQQRRKQENSCSTVIDLRTSPSPLKTRPWTRNFSDPPERPPARPKQTSNMDDVDEQQTSSAAALLLESPQSPLLSPDTQRLLDERLRGRGRELPGWVASQLLSLPQMSGGAAAAAAGPCQGALQQGRSPSEFTTSRTPLHKHGTANSAGVVSAPNRLIEASRGNEREEMRAFVFKNAKAAGMSDKDAFDEAEVYAKAHHNILYGVKDIVQEPKVTMKGTSTSSSSPIIDNGPSVTDIYSLLRPEQALMMDRFVMDITSVSKDDALYADFRKMTHQFAEMLLKKETSANSDASAAGSNHGVKVRASDRKNPGPQIRVKSRSRWKTMTEWIDRDSDEETDEKKARKAEIEADLKRVEAKFLKKITEDCLKGSTEQQLTKENINRE